MKNNRITINPELRNNPNAQGLRKIRIRITQNSKHCYVGTDLSLTKDFWNGKYNRWVSPKHPNSDAINSEIKNLITAYEEKLLELVRLNGRDSVLKEDLLNTKSRTDFIAYWDSLVKGMKNYNNSKGYDTCRKKMVEFQSDSFDFKIINKDWLTRFEKILIEKKLSEGTRFANLKRIRRVWNIAVDEKVIDAALYPFGKHGFKIPDPKRTRKIERLSKEELTRFINMKYYPLWIYFM